MSKQWNDSSKKVLRPFIVRRESRKSAKAAVFMPADTCFCVQEALVQGTVTLETKLLIIDRDRHVLGAAYEKLVKMGFHQDEIYMFCGNLQDSHIDKFHNSYGRPCTSVIDFIYLDTCGELTEQLHDFLNMFLRHNNISKECTLAFTFSNAERASHDFLWGKLRNPKSDALNKKAARFGTYDNDMYRPALRCAVIDNALMKLIGKTHMLAIGRGYKEQGPSVPMFTARYEPKRITHFRKYDKVPKNLGYKCS